MFRCPKLLFLSSVSKYEYQLSKNSKSRLEIFTHLSKVKRVSVGNTLTVCQIFWYFIQSGNFFICIRWQALVNVQMNLSIP